MGVIVRVPLDEGGLTGQVTLATTFPEGDFRNRYVERNAAHDAGPDLTAEQRAALARHRLEKRLYVG